MHAVASSTFLARWGGWPTSHSRNDNPIRVLPSSPLPILTSGLDKAHPITHTHPEHVKLGIDGPSQIDRCHTDADHFSRPSMLFFPPGQSFPCPAPPDMPLGINPLRNLPRTQRGQEPSSTALQPIRKYPTYPISDGRSCAGATAEHLIGRYQRTHSIHIGGDTGVRRQTDIIVCCPGRR